MRTVAVRPFPALPAFPFVPVAADVQAVNYVDHNDGRGWVAPDGNAVDEQMALLLEICYLNSTLDDESRERGQLLREIWCISRQLETTSLQMLLTTAITLRD